MKVDARAQKVFDKIDVDELVKRTGIPAGARKMGVCGSPATSSLETARLVSTVFQLKEPTLHSSPGVSLAQSFGGAVGCGEPEQVAQLPPSSRAPKR